MIKYFDNNDDIKEYIKNLAIKNVGKGTEGQVWLTKENDTIKYVLKAFRQTYKPSMLTEDDIKLESFIFPTEIFVENGFVAGYRARYFKDDIFNKMDTKTGSVINLEKLAIAREKMIKDIEVLTKAKYKIEDIENNLLFDGKRLIAIDTLDYPKINNIELYENIELLDYAIITRLVLIDSRVKRLQDSSFDEIVDYLADKDVFELTIPRMK